MTAVRLSAFFFALFAQAGAFVSYFGLFLTARGFSAAEIAFAVAMPQVARTVAPLFWGWLADWLDGARAVGGARRGIVIFGVFAYLGGYLALYRAESPGAVALVLLVMSLLTAGAGPLAEAITLS